MRRHTNAVPDFRVVRQAAAWCLSYPDLALIDTLGTIARALHEQPPTDAVERLLGFVDGTRSRALSALQEEYVAVFDLSRKHALYLSYWTDGDTRRRGEVLATFKQRYRDSGYLVNTHGELPDYLPMVLEFAATVDAEAGSELLQAYRPSIELLRIALREMESPYALVVEAICDTLPGASPRDRAEVMRMAGLGPPTERVGVS
jgi:nitrate reductase delta subunit